MANRDNPHGLRPLGRTLSGGFPTVDQFSKVVGASPAIFIWDAVNRVADGSIEAGATPGTTTYTGVSLDWGATLTATTHIVMISPDAVYEAQDNAATDGIAAADLGLNANLQLNAGSATTHISGHEINETGADVTDTLDVHLLRLHPSPDNAHGAWARIEIIFNKHRMNPGRVGV
jgi:hypothetical protein